MGGFFNAVGQYIAAGSPVGAEVYHAVTGQNPPPRSGQDPGLTLAHSIIGRYRRAGDTDPQTAAPAATPPPTATPPQPPAATPQPQQVGTQFGSMPGEGPIPDSAPQFGDPQGWNAPLQSKPKSPMPGKQSGAPGAEGEAEPSMADGLADSEGLADLAGGALLAAHGTVAGTPTLARVAESGPEFAGGQLVTHPSYVSLNKGDAVVPLTPRENNKLQPDMLEGHLAHPAGMPYSRYKSFGQSRVPR